MDLMVSIECGAPPADDECGFIYCQRIERSVDAGRLGVCHLLDWLRNIISTNRTMTVVRLGKEIIGRNRYLCNGTAIVWQ